MRNMMRLRPTGERTEAQCPNCIWYGKKRDFPAHWKTKHSVGAPNHAFLTWRRCRKAIA